MRVLILVALVVVVGCNDKKKASEPAPSKPVAGSAQADPGPKVPEASSACARYVAAMERFKACDKLDAGTRETFLRIFAQDEEAITGKRSAPASALETLCSARVQNVESVLASQCGAPLEQRSLEELRAELEKTRAAIAAMSAIVDDPKQSDVHRGKGRARITQLEKEKAELEALIEAKAATQKPDVTKPPGVSDECLNNPLAKGC
jgi:hypothetical protein